MGDQRLALSIDRRLRRENRWQTRSAIVDTGYASDCALTARWRMMFLANRVPLGRTMR
jgi:hypothetical protein